MDVSSLACGSWQVFHHHSQSEHDQFTLLLMHAGDVREVLEREIGVIKELLEEQPDSKCADGVV